MYKLRTNTAILIVHQEECNILTILTMWYSNNAIDNIEYCIANRYMVPRDILYPIFLSIEKDGELKVSITYKETGTLHIIQSVTNTIILPKQKPIITNGNRQNNSTHVLFILSTILSNI